MRTHSLTRQQPSRQFEIIMDELVHESIELSNYSILQYLSEI